MPFLRPAKQGLRIEMLRRKPGHRVERGWTLAEALLADISREAGAAGARTAVLVVPDRTQVDEDLWSAVVKEQGLDPNKWFGNVELIAAKDIGQETVQYVGNIYKYYVAYEMSLEQSKVREQARQTMKGN